MIVINDRTDFIKFRKILHLNTFHISILIKEKQELDYRMIIIA